VCADTVRFILLEHVRFCALIFFSSVATQREIATTVHLLFAPSFRTKFVFFSLTIYIASVSARILANFSPSGTFGVRLRFLHFSQAARR
jgi:hypothetical protein